MSGRFLFILAFFPLISCKTQQTGPDLLPESPPSLEFKSIEAFSIDQFALHYRLTAGNPRKQEMIVEIKDWKASLNGVELTRDSASLALDEHAAGGARFTAASASSTEKELVLHLNVKDARSTNAGTYLADLIVSLDRRYGNSPPEASNAAAHAEFPRIREPHFDIVSIAIIQADLVNTQFRADIRVDNPNMFDVNLSSLSYDLYGGGALWASGRENCLLHIPARGSCRTEFRFSMNFINMSRSLLDDIIAMRRVRYRFKGEAEVETGIDWLPSFHMTFERSGHSEVVK